MWTKVYILSWSKKKKEDEGDDNDDDEDEDEGSTSTVRSAGRMEKPKIEGIMTGLAIQIPITQLSILLNAEVDSGIPVLHVELTK